MYDVTGHVPVQKQKFNLPVTYNGLVWDASGTKFYVSGGASDVVYPFKKVGGEFQIDAPFIVLNTGGQPDKHSGWSRRCGSLALLRLRPGWH